ncbi:hypothetical protein CC78DRAFT_350084 [Lojkania enalia]|uniref:Uncharacterized protein n=1 Tax=Lojkania enalia TaxID=147567 RepID=A0A9P4N3M5_9PLEO|nr:hypothetical protein CC78DRAFT_350084 [Didymosphaeria enalia]
MNRMKWFRTAPRTRLASALSPHAQLRLQYSSISPSPSFVKPDQFNKTGLRGESDSTKINSRSNEYSQSGGDDIVAEQTIASFRVGQFPRSYIYAYIFFSLALVIRKLIREKDSKDTSPATAKETAGRGNVINPLDYSPASPELSKHIEDQTVCSSLIPFYVAKYLVTDNSYAGCGEECRKRS